MQHFTHKFTFDLEISRKRKSYLAHDILIEDRLSDNSIKLKLEHLELYRHLIYETLLFSQC